MGARSAPKSRACVVPQQLSSLQATVKVHGREARWGAEATDRGGWSGHMALLQAYLQGGSQSWSEVAELRSIVDTWSPGGRLYFWVIPPLRKKGNLIWAVRSELRLQEKQGECDMAGGGGVQISAEAAKIWGRSQKVPPSNASRPGQVRTRVHQTGGTSLVLLLRSYFCPQRSSGGTGPGEDTGTSRRGHKCQAFHCDKVTV